MGFEHADARSPLCSMQLAASYFQHHSGVRVLELKSHLQSATASARVCVRFGKIYLKLRVCTLSDALASVCNVCQSELVPHFSVPSLQSAGMDLLRGSLP